MIYRRVAKRLLDLALVLLASPLWLPVLGLAALAVWERLGWPVLFRQERTGLGGQAFTLTKLRTMTDARDDAGHLLPDAGRLTPFGRWLRRTSLDELPELWNVLRGEMSLVGPRPLYTRYLGRYTAEQARRHEVRPGITGWAQVNGRNLLTWEQKFALDVWYVDHVSFLLDVRILLLTLGKILKREGITQPGQATAQEFVARSEAVSDPVIAKERSD
jgi:sugar transferase EpsL